MSLRPSAPAPADLRRLARRSTSAPLTYRPIGISAAATAPPGFRLDRWSCTLGRGGGVFRAAVATLRAWRVHTGAGLLVEAEGPPSVGLVVAMAAPLPIGFVDVVCRVVSVVDEPGRAGFTYGSLPIHPEAGEESFTVEWSADGTVTFEIRAASRPRHALARACPPLTRRLQAAATARYLDAMRDATASRAEVLTPDPGGRSAPR